MVLLDRLNGALARLAAVLYVLIGLMLAWEVAARYVFNAPTIWAEELSRLLLVWGSMLGMAWLIKGGRHIRITVVLEKLGPGARRVLEIFALLCVGAFALGLVWYGWAVAVDSLSRGRTSGTMLDLPLGWSQLAVPVGGLLILSQALVEALRLAMGGEMSALNHGEEE